MFSRGRQKQGRRRWSRRVNYLSIYLELNCIYFELNIFTSNLFYYFGTISTEKGVLGNLGCRLVSDASNFGLVNFVKMLWKLRENVVKMLWKCCENVVKRLWKLEKRTNTPQTLTTIPFSPPSFFVWIFFTPKINIFVTKTYFCCTPRKRRERTRERAPSRFSELISYLLSI